MVIYSGQELFFYHSIDMRKLILLAIIILAAIAVSYSKTEYINMLPGPYRTYESLENTTMISTNEEPYSDEAIYLNFNQDNFYINTVKPKNNPVPMPTINLKDYNPTS
jgi:hypothetical protein